MGKIFKGSIRVTKGGVVRGHFMVEAEFSGTRPMLEGQVSNGPLTRQTDDDSAVAEIRIRSLADSVLNRNFLGVAAEGGECEVTAMTGVDQATLDKFSPWEFGDFGHTTSREAAVQNVTLVGTNRVREDAWYAAQADLPGAVGGA